MLKVVRSTPAETAAASRSTARKVGGRKAASTLRCGAVGGGAGGVGAASDAAAAEDEDDEDDEGEPRMQVSTFPSPRLSMTPVYVPMRANQQSAQ